MLNNKTIQQHRTGKRNKETEWNEESQDNSNNIYIYIYMHICAFYVKVKVYSFR